MSVDEDIARAATLPVEWVRDAARFATLRERVLARSWQLVPDAAPGEAVPFRLLDGCLDEPLVMVRDGDTLRCLSNVCTHRGNLLVHERACVGSLRCRYHGRRFGLDGRMQSAPEFEGARDFPGDSDHLPVLPVERLGPLAFTSLAPAFSFAALTAPLRSRLHWLAFDSLRRDPAGDRSYEVAAHWLLYCDNYLEGLHIPFVHAGLSQMLDYGAYHTELHDYGTLQIGVASDGEDAFTQPEGAADHGRNIAAYYYYLFPNLMFNFYPWGLSLNVVTPLALARTRIDYRVYVLDESRRGRGAGAELDRVEREDDQIVESVQAGVRARLYRGGRYSPSRETGVHHFHRLLLRLAGE